jgi:tellurite resistance protein
VWIFGWDQMIKFHTSHHRDSAGEQNSDGRHHAMDQENRLKPLGPRKGSETAESCSGAPAGRVQSINLELARIRFAAALAQAMEDGILNAQEEERLREIAASHGCDLPQFARQFFQSEGEAFLRGIFLACVADGHISQEEWNYLVSAAHTLGIRLDELLKAIQPQAQRFVEHVLADARADGRLSAHEEATLRWLTDNLGLPDHYRDYIRQEMSRKQDHEIRENGPQPPSFAPFVFRLISILCQISEIGFCPGPWKPICGHKCC